MSFIMGCYKTSSTGAIRVNANFVDFRGRRMKKESVTREQLLRKSGRLASERERRVKHEVRRRRKKNRGPALSRTQTFPHCYSRVLG